MNYEGTAPPTGHYEPFKQLRVMKTIYDLTREEIIEVKQNFLIRLADEGRFAEFVGVDYDAPAWGDLADADMIVPDVVILYEYADTIFSEDDFSI